MRALNTARATLLDFAAKHPDAIVPAYTVGVQAQPISFGHYILAYAQALERDGDRLAAGLRDGEPVAARLGGARHVELPG